jgi:hypothetical protein
MSVLRRPSLAVAFCTLLGLLAGSAPLRAADLFPDKALLAAVRDGLKKGEGRTQGRGPKNLTPDGAGKTQTCPVSRSAELASIELPKNEIADTRHWPVSRMCRRSTRVEQDVDVTPLAGSRNCSTCSSTRTRSKTSSRLGLIVTSLYLSTNKIKSIAAVAGLEKLAALYVDHNEISDISPVKGLKWLERLDLRKNAVADLSPLAGLTELRYTMLQENKVTDLAILVEMAKKDAAGEKRFAPFWKLYLKANPLTDAAKTTQVAELKTYNVRVDLEK